MPHLLLAQPGLGTDAIIRCTFSRSVLILTREEHTGFVGGPAREDSWERARPQNKGPGHPALRKQEPQELQQSEAELVGPMAGEAAEKGPWRSPAVRDDLVSDSGHLDPAAGEELDLSVLSQECLS